MKKTILAFLLLALFAFPAQRAEAYATESTTVTASGWIITAGDGGFLLTCTAYSGNAQYLAKITTTTGVTLGWLAATTDSTFTRSFTHWTSTNAGTGYEPGAAGVYLTESSGASNAFTTCDTND